MVMPWAGSMYKWFYVYFVGLFCAGTLVFG